MRFRAALEERDIDDLYRNALTELRDVLGPSDDNAQISSETIRASFVRFLESSRCGPYPGWPAHPNRRSARGRSSIGIRGCGVRNSAGQQSSGFIALNSERQLSALRQNRRHKNRRLE